MKATVSTEEKTESTKNAGKINKRKRCDMRKAPQAPKRFKSSYILFCMHIQTKIKAEPNEKLSVRTISDSIISITSTLLLIFFHPYQ